MKVSVIVAAYNAEKYVAETMESLVNQTIRDYEIIVVNDGSEDGTIGILEEYRDAYSNITVIDKENGGPSSARNAGLDIARGEYVYFFDADDILELDALAMLYKRAVTKKADLVIAKYDIFNRFRTFAVNGINKLVSLDRIEKYDTQILWTFSLCNKLFRRSLIEQYSLRLPPISYSEDGAFLMDFVYHCQRITGLDKVIFHYRRMYDGVAESITASITPEKIRDYIKAHQLIYESAVTNIMIDYPRYESIEEAKQNNADIHKYLNEISRKELQILLDQFYSKFWDLDQDTVEFLMTEIRNKLDTLDMRDISILTNSHPEYSLFDLPVTKAEARAKPYFAVALYGENGEEEDFLNSLESLTLQNLISLLIYVPSAMQPVVEENGLGRDNIEYVPVSSEEELFFHVIDSTKAPYVTFGNPKVAYANNAFKYAFKHFIKTTADFLIELIYHRNYGDIQAVLLNRVALNSLKGGYEYTPYLSMDHTLANKFFRVEFLREVGLDRKSPLLSQLVGLYHSGYFIFMNDGTVFFEDKEERYVDFVSTEQSRPFIEEYMEDRPVDLMSEELLPDSTELLPKMTQFPADRLWKILFRKIVAFMRRRPVKERVLFFSIRKDGELEGNAKALYPYIKGEKVICAKQLPHGIFTELKMFYQTFTSRVVITDDYDRYLRNFPLRRSQRVIQLWHACGAFKKFGQRGTNLSVFTDNATHAQYNLVCVSSEGIRPIYADAFGIDLHRVKALGCPRTDAFFDKAYIEKTKADVYSAYPQWKDKYIIIYAPTFRDMEGDRTEFHPAIDFGQLSRDLLPNQVFLVCPHPVMKNRIVDGDYPNIQVVRDFSTNALMHVSDMLITDYSSVIFEYALLRKPIAFFCYDLVAYNRGFYLDYPDDLPGDIYENQEELTRYIQTESMHGISDKHNSFLKKYMSACDGHSCERIAELVNTFMEDRGNGS